METRRCPCCGAAAVIPGVMAHDGGQGNPAYFTPPGVRVWRMQVGVYLPGTFSACTACGHTWSALDPSALRAFVDKYGNELLKDYLADLADGVGHGLPDHPDALRAAEGVAEVNALVLSGQPAARRYRELTGRTWDQATADLRGWSRLARDRKLALFGWDPPEKTPKPAEGVGAAAHPLHDPALDGSA